MVGLGLSLQLGVSRADELFLRTVFPSRFVRPGAEKDRQCCCLLFYTLFADKPLECNCFLFFFTPSVGFSSTNPVLALMKTHRWMIPFGEGESVSGNDVMPTAAASKILLPDQIT
jgi:hypothetical protein